MATELTKEQFEQLPDFLKDDYKEIDGVYKNGAIMTLKKTNDELNSRFNTVDIELKEFKVNQESIIEEAKKKALEDAKNSKDVDAIEKQYQERMADLEKRTTDRVRSETLSEFKKEQSVKEAANIAKVLGAELAVEDAKDDLTALIQMRIKANDNGEIVFYNADGSASAMTKDEFKADIKAKHKRLVKGESTTTGSGIASGNTGGSAEVKPTNTAANNLSARLKAKGLIN